MRDLQKYFEEGKRIVAECGIQTGVITSCTVNTRAKSRWGQCRKDKKTGTFSINISSQLLDDAVPSDSLLSTIVHEILHATDAKGHGTKWKSYAAMVMREYPNLKIKRISTPKELGVKEEPKKPRRRIARIYEIQCDGPCQCIHRSSRMSKTIKHPELYRCINGYPFHAA